MCLTQADKTDNMSSTKYSMAASSLGSQTSQWPSIKVHFTQQNDHAFYPLYRWGWWKYRTIFPYQWQSWEQDPETLESLAVIAGQEHEGNLVTELWAFSFSSKANTGTVFFRDPSCRISYGFCTCTLCFQIYRNYTLLYLVLLLLFS